MNTFVDTSRIIQENVNTTFGCMPLKYQLLKWIGNKQRFAKEIISYFPIVFGVYHEPFLGSGGVLATLAPNQAYASDSFQFLIEIFQTLKDNPKLLISWYKERWELFSNGNRKKAYEFIKESYNRNPNPADLVFISRACYGGVIRFRRDGYISTPIGPHNPISPESFENRVFEWYPRIKNSIFSVSDFSESMLRANPGDVIYCDPPYYDSQQILYGAQDFSLAKLFDLIYECKRKDVYVILSIDGTKKSGNKICDLPIPNGLFKREVMVKVGRSMLKRLQMSNQTLENEVVRDRLLLSY